MINRAPCVCAYTYIHISTTGATSFVEHCVKRDRRNGERELPQPFLPPIKIARNPKLDGGIASEGKGGNRRKVGEGAVRKDWS